ncbi:DUF445 family protein [Salinispira pacifica]|uniref:DUF445 family protein n=1 Tax=Salinispira pacifica TaxID=1307761 RepID=V5WGP1_9SPIO|nr:DUF445 family protein [Salinispira pacifica]AHC14331.1 hypothetical protein L21SP2_0911 [Salinispira pacifica]
MAVREMLIYALPPLLGAVIGYVTNALAIRMLFRPLTRKFFLGIPLPLTPGIIPRQREQLAHSIARMVSRSLFNTQVILGHIRGEAFQHGLVLQIRQIFTPGKQDHRGDSSTLAGENPRGKADETPSETSNETSNETPEAGPQTVEDVEAKIRSIEKLLVPLLTADVTRNLLRVLIERLSAGLGKRGLDTILPSRLYESDSLETLFRNLIEGNAYRKLSWALVLWLRRHESENTRISEFFTRVQLSRTMHVIDRFYTPGVNGLMAFLRRPDIRRELVRRGKRILSDILLRLRPVQRMMLSAGQYDRTLEENMPDIVRDLLRTLEDTLRSRDNREKILMALHQFIAELQGQGLKDVEKTYGIVLSRNLYRMLNRFRSILLQGDAPRRLADLVSRGVLGSGNVNDILLRITSMDLEHILMKLYNGFYEVLDSPGRREEFRSLIQGIILEARQQGEASQQSPPAGTDGTKGDDRDVQKDSELPAAAASVITGILEGAVPVLVERFDVYRMVVDRINSLDIEEVEGLLLGIIARHLKYINIFGAVLGALIGGLQVVLRIAGI